MKTLYESILDVDKDYDDDILIKSLFSKDLRQRRRGFDNLLLMVESHRSKQHKTVDKMKNSDSYFVEFTWDIKDITGEPVQILDWICSISICKKIGSDYNATYIGAKDIRFSGMGVEVIKSDYFGYIQPYFNPKQSHKKLYEVPEELNGLFEQIQTEAHKHKKR